MTLAGVLTLPLALPDGSPFPARDLAIFLAAGVIIVSLVMASLSLPHLLKEVELPPEPSHQEAEDRARIAAASAAIHAIERAQHVMAKGGSDADLYADIGARLMETYRQRIGGRSKTGDEAALVRKGEEIERNLRLAALRAERDALYRAARAREVDQEAVRLLVRELDLLEARLTAG